MSCDRWASAIDAMIDNELNTGASERLEAHLATCEPCQAVVADLRSLRQETAALPLAIEPPRDLWPAIADRLPAKPAANARRWRPWGMGTLLAAAAGTLMIVGIWLTQARLSPGPDTTARVEGGNGVVPVATTRLSGPAIAATRDAATSLRAQVQTRWASLTPATRDVLERNLDVIDQAVLEIEAALASEPEDQGLQSLLLASYRQQISLLERLVELG